MNNRHEILILLAYYFSTVRLAVGLPTSVVSLHDSKVAGA